MSDATSVIGADEAGRTAGGEEARRPAGRSVNASIEIDAPIERVWKALTDADELERWFPLEARVEPGVGGEVWMSWKNEWKGASRILAWEPPRRLVTTWGEVDGGTETGQQTEYLLQGHGGTTVLRVVTSGFPDDPSWDAWVEGTERGWAFELSSLKHYLEHHAGQPREVVYLRRRVDLSQADAWARLTGPEGFPTERFRGAVVDDTPPVQYAARTVEPKGLLRLSIEPCHGSPDGKDVTVFFSAWGPDGGRASSFAEESRTRLESLFPEGTFA